MVASMNGTNGTHAGTTTEYEGLVQRTNERGLLLAGREGWLNISRFAGAVEMPEPGQRVRLTLDKSGYIRAITPLSAPASEAAAEPERGQNRGTSAQASRETAIIRQNVLSHATRFVVACGGTVEDLLAVAERLEAWVNR